MDDTWTEMSYNKFPSFETDLQRSDYEGWCDHLDNEEALGVDECLDLKNKYTFTL